MTATPQRKLSLTPLLLTPLLLGLFFLLFVVTALALLFQPGTANPLLVLAVVGMAVVGVLTIKHLLVRARDAEQALEEGERYIEAVAELSQDVHAIIETRTRSFLYLNAAVEELLGYPQEAFLKGGLEFFHTLVHPEDLELLHQHSRLLMEPRPLTPGEAEAIQEQDFRIRNPQGEYRWFKSRRNVFVRFADGRPAEFLAVVQSLPYRPA